MAKQLPDVANCGRPISALPFQLDCAVESYRLKARALGMTERAEAILSEELAVSRKSATITSFDAIGNAWRRVMREAMDAPL